MFNNKVVFISGGTGSFGRAFTKDILKNYKPKKIIIFSRDELKQFELSQTLNHKSLRYFLGDVRDFDRLNLAMNGVDFVVHAAALKQVPAAEYNPTECIKTNIHGADNIIKASILNKVKKIIALSTDKAANPINLYGATKLVSDKLFIAANNIVGAQKILFSVVRYGNVAGSRGSVIPVFKQISNSKKNNCIPITDENMTRFWITLPEGVNFVKKSFELMRGGEIFVPKLPSVEIIDLAKAIAPNRKIKIIGSRPGEKINEIMCPADSSGDTIEFTDYYCIKPSIKFSHVSFNYKISKNGEVGKYVEKDFEYNSGKNSHFIKIKGIKDFLKNDSIQ
jgi:UDP-N-acetylglucosamine 4,6-dehydratase